MCPCVNASDCRTGAWKSFFINTAVFFVHVIVGVDASIAYEDVVNVRIDIR